MIEIVKLTGNLKYHRESNQRYFILSRERKDADLEFFCNRSRFQIPRKTKRTFKDKNTETKKSTYLIR